MLEKIEIGKTYINGDLEKFTVIFIGKKLVAYTDKHNDECTGYLESSLKYWSELPKEEEKWFEVVYFHKKGKMPVRMANLYKSENDFLDYCGCKKDYHWISLKEFKME